VAIDCRSGTPTTSASRSDGICSAWCGNPSTMCVDGSRMPIRLATPGGTLTSWMIVGVLRRQAAR
jgi:hypothetical protein